MGDGGIARLRRAGDADRREAFGDGEDRPHDQLNQGDQRHGQPRAAVRGDALGKLAELSGKPLLGRAR